MSITEKSISYYLTYLRDNPTTELDLPTISMLLQAFRAYLIENIEAQDERIADLEEERVLYAHYINLTYYDGTNEDALGLGLVIINDSSDAYTIDTLKTYIEENTSADKPLVACGYARNEGDYGTAHNIFYENEEYKIHCLYTNGLDDVDVYITDYIDNVTFIDNTIEI